MPIKDGYVMRDDRPAGGRLHEAGTQTCQHCGTVVILTKLRKRAREHCPRCMEYICDPCAREYRFTQVCTNIQQGMDLALRYPRLATPFQVKKSQNDLELRERVKVR